ncbi:MAG: hypothetical protein AABY22_10950 [Nanoarchaeota archaeon]
MDIEKLREEFFNKHFLDIRLGISAESIFDFFLPHLKSEAVEVSDEEIEEMYPKDDSLDSIERDYWIQGFSDGLKWMRDKQGIAPSKEVEEKCIEFAEWVESNGWIYQKKAKEWRRYVGSGFDYLTTKELFNQFIKEGETK